MEWNAITFEFARDGGHLIPITNGYHYASRMTISSSKPNLFVTFCKYLVAGGMGFLLDFSALYLLFNVLGMHYLVAATIAFTVGLIFVYLTSNKWVFEERRMEERQVLEFTLFAIIGVVGLGLTVLFMWILVDMGGLYPLIAKLITTGLVLCWNFGARKYLLY